MQNIKVVLSLELIGKVLRYFFFQLIDAIQWGIKQDNVTFN